MLTVAQIRTIHAVLTLGHIRIIPGETPGCPGCSQQFCCGGQSQPSPPLLADEAGKGAVTVPVSSNLQNEHLQTKSNLGHAGCPQDVTAQSWQGCSLPLPQPDLSHFSSCLHFFSNSFQVSRENSFETLTVRLPALLMHQVTSKSKGNFMKENRLQFLRRSNPAH